MLKPSKTGPLSGSITLERVGNANNIALFTINRTDKCNAYHNDMIRMFLERLTTTVADSSIRAGIITGAGNDYFCAGADLTQFRHKTYQDGLDLLSRQLFNQLADAPWPTIAAISGPAIGGGLELALACDFRICASHSWFQLPETGIGLIPAAGGIYRLPQIINPVRAKEMILLGQKIDSQTALSWGLVSKISKQVLTDSIITAEIIATKDVLATQLAKRLLQSMEQQHAYKGIEAFAQALLYNVNENSKG